MGDVKSFRQLIGIQPSTVSTSDSTLIIIDAQNEYAQGALKTVNVESSRKAIANLLNKYRESGPHGGKNIVHVLHQTPKGAPVFTPDTELAKEFEELTPKEGEHVIHKNYPSSFEQTDLEEYLKSVPKDAGKKLVLTGYMSHVCVSSTTKYASHKGYDVVIASDAVGDRDIPGVDGAELTRVTLRELEDAFATVIESSEVKA